MKLYDVYPLVDINGVKGKGCHVWDDKGDEYLDLYGGHAVISIGLAHPHYVEMISNQVAQLGLLPLAKNLLLNDDVMVNAITGSTGAGVKPGATSHFSRRNNNMSV